MANVNRQKLAVAGGQKAVTMPAPAWPVSGPTELKWMTEVVETGKWSWLGAHERAFCEEYSKFIGSRYAIGLANGTVTLQCALQAVGIVPGETTPNYKLTLEVVYCLGSCGIAPVALVNEKVCARLNSDALVQRVKALG